VIISLEIVNTYELYPTVTTYVTDVEVPDPPNESDANAWDNWVYEQIHDRTGVGHPEGDSWYDVTVTACSDPSWVGREFDFGY
jgi:hypothetical protein